MNSDESTKIKAMYSRSGHKGQPGYGLPLTTLFWLWPIPIFFTRNQLVIASINVTSTDHSHTLANGNQIADLGTCTKTDGSTGSTAEVSGNLGDINLAQDNFHRQFTTPLDTSAVATLPDMQGSGTVRDLREAR